MNRSDGKKSVADGSPQPRTDDAIEFLEAFLRADRGIFWAKLDGPSEGKTFRHAMSRGMRSGLTSGKGRTSIYFHVNRLRQRLRRGSEEEDERGSLPPLRIDDASRRIAVAGELDPPPTIIGLLGGVDIKRLAARGTEPATSRRSKLQRVA